MTRQKFDISLQIRSSYKKPFGEAYLKLKQEYNIDGSQLVKRVFADAEEIIAYRKIKEAELLQQKQEAEKGLLKLKTR